MSGLNRRTDLGMLFSTCATLIAPAHQHIGGTPYRPQITRPVRPGRERLLPRVAQTIQVWHERVAMRRELAALDDHVLSDIGLSRAQVEAEWHKPFWRA